MQNKDVSKEIVIILLILTVIVALVGTFSVTNAAGNINFEKEEEINKDTKIKTSGFVTKTQQKATNGRVSLIILNPGDELQWIQYQIKA